MRILIMGGYPLGENRSGSIIHAQKLSQAISKLDDTEVHVLTMDRTASQFKNGEVNIHVITMPSIPAVFLLPFTFRKARRLIHEISPDVIHVMGERFPYPLIAVPLRGKYPLVMSVFSLAVKELRFRKSPYLFLKTTLLSEPSMKYAIPRVTRFIVQSNFTAGIVRERTGARIDIIPEGVDFTEFTRVKADSPASGSPDIFLAVNFRRLKGLDVLIKAISIVAKSLPGVKLYIAGGGEEEERLKILVKDLALESNVRFLGFISDEEKIYQYYKSCKIVVVPSRWDIEPFAVLHGAAAGKPVIASVACHSSVVIDGQTGFSYETEDFNDLAGKIVKLLTNDTLREEMSKAASVKAQEYDWSRIAAKTVDIYREEIESFQKKLKIT